MAVPLPETEPFEPIPGMRLRPEDAIAIQERIALELEQANRGERPARREKRTPDELLEMLRNSLNYPPPPKRSEAERRALAARIKAGLIAWEKGGRNGLRPARDD
jgi:hypothetical protein